MRNSVSTYQLEERSSPISALLDMVWRKGPHYLRAGGGGISGDSDSLHHGRPTTAEDRAKFAFLLAEGKSLHEISNLTGFAYNTVVKHTRHLRT